MESDSPAETHQPVSEWSGMKRLHDCTVQQQQTLSVLIIQGRSHWFGWPGFNRTTFEATTTFLPIFTNSAACPAEQLAATRPQLTEPEIDSLKAMLPSLQSAKVSWDPILITEKWRWKKFSALLRRRIGTIYAPLFWCSKAASPPTATIPLQISWLQPCYWIRTLI